MTEPQEQYYEEDPELGKDVELDGGDDLDALLDAEEKDHNLVEVKTKTDTYRMRGRACELSAFSYVPPDVREPAERNYFNTRKEEKSGKARVDPGDIYDRLFHPERTYNQKLHRDDREHAKLHGLNHLKEETQRELYVLASTEYGRKLAMAKDHPDRKHVRIAYVNSEFYRRNGVPVNQKEAAAEYQH